MKNQTSAYAILSGAFCASLIISNILAFKTFVIGNIVLPAAVVIFPVVYIANDVMTEVFGYTKAKKIILTAFTMNIVAVICYTIAIELPYPGYFQEQEAFEAVLSNSPKVLVASMSAYLFGSIVNANVMEKMRNKSHLATRCILSTLCGESLDAFVFITIAFIGTMPISELLTMVLAQAIFKTMYEILVFPITSKVIKKVKTQNRGGDIEHG